MFVKKAAHSRILKVFSEDGSFTYHHTFMAHLDGQSNQVYVDNPNPPKCDNCIEFEGKMEHMKCHNQNLICDSSKCTEAHTELKKNEKEFRTTIEALRKRCF
ncbi:hypothetical protein Hanom_Chr09g00763851 [Helianthus anomalus]